MASLRNWIVHFILFNLNWNSPLRPVATACSNTYRQACFSNCPNSKPHTTLKDKTQYLKTSAIGQIPSVWDRKRHGTVGAAETWPVCWVNKSENGELQDSNIRFYLAAPGFSRYCFLLIWIQKTKLTAKHTMADGKKNILNVLLISYLNATLENGSSGSMYQGHTHPAPSQSC